MKRKELVNTLELVKPALSDMPYVQVLECFHFTGSTVYAYNDELAIIAPCKTDMPFAVHGRILLGLLTNSTAEEVTMTPIIEGDARSLVVKADRNTSKLPYFSEEEFLFEEPEVGFRVPGPPNEAFISSLEHCLVTTGNDLARPAFMCVRLFENDGALHLASSDGDAITVCSVGKAEIQCDVALSKAFCETFISLSSTHKPHAIGIGEEWAHGRFEGGISIYGRLMVIDNPLDHTQVMADTIGDNELTYFSIPEEFKQALNRARVIADAESAMTTVDVTDGRMKFYTETGMGDIRDSIPVANTNVRVIGADVSAELVSRMSEGANAMAVLPHCTVFTDDKFIRVISNLGR